MSDDSAAAIDIDVFADGYLADPHSVLGPLRDRCPVAHIEALDVYAVTSHELVTAVLGDPDTFSNKRERLGKPVPPDLVAKLAEIRSEGWAHAPTIADEDPPLHDAYRNIVAPFFTTSRLRRFVPQFTGICESLIERWDMSQPIDFIEEFASPLPLMAVAAVLDLPTDDPAEQLRTFARWRDAATASVGSDLSNEETLAAEREVVAMQQYLADRIHHSGRPDDDLFAALRTACITDLDGRTRGLTMEEMLTIGRQIFVGGVETTTNSLAELMIQLDGRPDLFRMLRDDHTRRRILEESLRLGSPAQGIMRVTTRNVVLGGCRVPAGAHVLVLFSSANRDPGAFDRPDELDPTRHSIAQHLAFGRGVHVCLGAAFARTEMQAALDVLSRRLRSYRVIDREQVVYRRSFILRGPQQVLIEAVAA